MNYYDIFQAYADKQISEGVAEKKLKSEIEKYVMCGCYKEAAQADIMKTYFIRYRQYNHGEIGVKDFLLNIRDLILFVGKNKLPRLVTDAISRSGSEFGLYVNDEGLVDVSPWYPEYLSKQINLVEEVYRLDDSEIEKSEASSGDELLSKNSIFTKYRSFEQKIAVHSAVELPDDYTLMISLPTGGGKSLITQILAAKDKKLTLVIVPTVSLAIDQYNQAKKYLVMENIDEAIFYYKGGMSDTDVKKVTNALNNKTARMIIASPEAILKSEKLNMALLKAAEDQYLKNVVIDEAHIVPDWGIKFRPEFQIFSVMLKELRQLAANSIRTYLLSATLSDDVVETLFSLYGKEGKNLEYRCDALRQEPRFVYLPDRGYKSRENKIYELIKCLPKPMIIYVIEPKTAENYRKQMQKMGFKNICTFTGDTKEYQRDEILKKWKQNEIDIIFATSAFGVGVDKSNVRTIIHACVPENLSRFYQEVGRAGRDGLPSLSVMVPYVGKDDSDSDLSVAFGLVKGNVLTVKYLVSRWESILKNPDNEVEGDVVTADLNTIPYTFTEEQAEHAGIQNMGWNVNMLLLLYRQKYIDLLKVKFDPVKQTYYFTIKLLDTDLLTDYEKLKEALEPSRQTEYSLQVEGYYRMRDLIHKPNGKCWAKHFTSLFPLANYVCRGCPVHEMEKKGSDNIIKIRRPLLVQKEPGPLNRQLRRLMGGVLLDLMLTTKDIQEIDICELIVKVEDLGVSALVLPDVSQTYSSTKLLVLNYDEYCVVAQDIPWILSNGSAFVLGSNDYLNNLIFSLANSEVNRNYRKIWICNENTYITSRQKRMNDFLNGRIEDLERL